MCLCLIPLYDEKFKLVRSGKEIGVSFAGDMAHQTGFKFKRVASSKTTPKRKKNYWLTGKCYLHADNLNCEDLAVALAPTAPDTLCARQWLLKPTE